MIRKLFQKMIGIKQPVSPRIRTRELLGYFLRKGFGSGLRGFWCQWGFKSFKGRLFLGRNCQIFFPRFIALGKGVYIAPHCYINGLSENGMYFGNRVHIREYAWIQATGNFQQPGVGLRIGSGTYIGPHSYIGAGGGIEIGENVVMGAYVNLLAENHVLSDLTKPVQEQGVTREGIKIGNNVWIGNHAIILDGVEIGSGCVIGAGAVVTHSVPDNAVAAGNPAKVIRSRA